MQIKFLQKSYFLAKTRKMSSYFDCVLYYLAEILSVYHLPVPFRLQSAISSLKQFSSNVNKPLCRPRALRCRR